MTDVLDALTLAEQIAEPPPRARERLSQSVLSRWPGQLGAADQAMRSSDRTLGN